MSKDKINKSWYFLFVVGFIFVLSFLFDSEKFYNSLRILESLLEKIIPIFVLIFILMFLLDYFIKPSVLVKHFGNRGIKSWGLAILGGIISSGPIYLWYPLLANLKSKGISDRYIATFLYNRAIKIPLLPLMALYFSWKLIIALTLTMIVFSIFNGLLVEKIVDGFENKNS